MAGRVESRGDDEEEEKNKRLQLQQRQEEGGEGGSSWDGSDSGSWFSESDELEPEWLDEVQPNGELFYLELSEGEETAALAQEEEEAGSATPSSGGAPTQDAARRKERGGPKLRKLADILRRRKTTRRELPADRANGDRKGHSGDTVFTKGPGDGGDGGDDAPPPLVVARLRFRDVTVYVNPLRRPTGERDIRLGEEAPLLGSLLGIVHRASGRQGRDARSGRKSRSEDSVAPIADEKISVHGLVHGGAAMESGKIYIGDSLVAVNDVDVTTENIERVLSCIPGPMKVRLTMEVEGCSSTSHGRAEGDEESSAVSSHSGLVRLLSGEDTADLHARLSSHPHFAMYLSLRLDSESACEEEDIIYSFPQRGPAARLRAVRGIFLTLSDMLPRVTGDSVRSSSMVIEGRLVHVAYWREGDGLLLLGLPADRVPLARLRNLISDLARLLSLLHGSLHKAFNQRTEGPGHLDQLFSLLFQHCLEPESLCTYSGPGAPAASSPVGLHPHCSGAEFLDNLPAAPWLPLPQDIKVDIDTTLSELESADFQELSEDYYSMRRLYTILGSCLFYKGCLVANHLPREELTAVTLYCRLHGLLLLARSPRAGQLVVWRELFPRKPHTAVATGYSPPEGARHFLLIVGLDPCLLSMVLEAGGCSACAVGSPGPDPGYVEEARATLLALDSLSVPARIREHLERPPLPELSCADCFLGHSTGGGSTVFSPGHRRTQSSPGFRGPRRLSPSPARGRQDGADSPAPSATAQRSAEGGVPGMPGRRESQGSGVSAGSGGSSGVTSAFKITKKRSSPFLLGGGWRESADADTQEMSSVCRLTSGADNTLFHYVSLEVAEGVYIAPAHSDVERLGGTLHAQLLANFHRCCLSIRALFQQSSPLARTDQPDVLQGSLPSDLRGERSPLGRVREHGVLFNCSAPFWNDPKKPAPTLTYWVLGGDDIAGPEPRWLRLWPRQTTLIVMYGRVVSRLFAGGCAVPSRSLNSFPACGSSSWRCRTLPFQTSSRFSIHDVEQCKRMFSTCLTPETGVRDTGHAESRLLAPADERTFTSSSKPAGCLNNTEHDTPIDDPQADVIVYGRNVSSNRKQGNSRLNPKRAAPIATERVRTATEKGDLLEPKIEMAKLLATCETPSDVLELELDGLAPKLLNLDVTATTGEPSAMGAVDFAVHPPDVLDTRPCSLLIACWRTLRALPPDRAAYEQRRMLQHPRFPGLCQQVLRTSRYLTPGLLGYTLAAAARLGIPLRSRLVQMLMRTAQVSINEFNGRALGVVASCLPFLLQDRNTQALRAALTMRAQLALPEVDKVPVLLMLMYHLGPTVPTALKDKLVTQAWVLFVLDQFTTANVLRLFFSLARMQHNAPELLSAASPIIIGNLQELKFSELLQLLKACNQLGYHNTRLFSSIAEHAVTSLQLYSLNEACTLLLLLSKLRFRHPGLLDAVALLLLQEQQQAQPMPCHLDKKNLMVLLHVYSLLNHQPHGAAETFLGVLSSALEHHLPELSVHELFVGVRALCILGYRPPSAVASALLADHSCTQLLNVSDSVKCLQNEFELQAIRLSLHLQKKLPGVPAAEAAPSSPDLNPSSLTRCPELPSVLIEALRGSGQVRVGVTVGGLYSIDAEVTLQETEVLQLLQGNECLALPDHLHNPGDNPHNQGDCLHVPEDGVCILGDDPLPKPLRFAMLCCHPAEFCLGSQHPCGKLALKVWNLHALGYRVTLVSSSQWKRLQPECRVPFLRQKLQLASGMAAECGR